MSLYLCFCVCQGCFPADYILDEVGQGGLSCLDINHSHFLLVDDGTHKRYGVEIELRARLEKLISQQPLGKRGELMENRVVCENFVLPTESEVTIPVVCVVLDGGPGTLNVRF